MPGESREDLCYELLNHLPIIPHHTLDWPKSGLGCREDNKQKKGKHTIPFEAQAQKHISVAPFYWSKHFIWLPGFKVKEQTLWLNGSNFFFLQTTEAIFKVNSFMNENM